MLPLAALTPAHLGAVVLAALGAVLFGLAAVRQHGVVRATAPSERLTVRGHLRAAWALLRTPAWLVGAGQAGLGGALHIVALALAPITLVQPIGVLAVPVTVVATAVREGRAPRRTQVLGSLLSVVGIAALTVVLLMPVADTPTLPVWPTLAGTVAVLVGLALAVILAGGRRRPLTRCVALAVTAAVLFGLSSILIRTLGQVAALRSAGVDGPVLVTALVGLAAALPLGVWAMQRAYVSGSSQVVICCLTLMDPLSAVLGGRLLLHDGGPLTGATLVGALLCGLLTAGGVLLLSADYPVEDGPVVPDPVPPGARTGA